MKKASEEAEAIAEELLEVYSKRKISKTSPLIANNDQENTFKESVPYVYTQDQDTVIGEILSDLSRDIPMDRLLV